MKQETRIGRSLRRLVSRDEQVAEMRRLGKRLVRLGIAMKYTAGFDTKAVAVAESIDSVGGVLYAYSREYEATANNGSSVAPGEKGGASAQTKEKIQHD